jgi:hypothetical protein
LIAIKALMDDAHIGMRKKTAELVASGDVAQATVIRQRV